MFNWSVLNALILSPLKSQALTAMYLIYTAQELCLGYDKISYVNQIRNFELMMNRKLRGKLSWDDRASRYISSQLFSRNSLFYT